MRPRPVAQLNRKSTWSTKKSIQQHTATKNLYDMFEAELEALCLQHLDGDGTSSATKPSKKERPRLPSQANLAISSCISMRLWFWQPNSAAGIRMYLATFHCACPRIRCPMRQESLVECAARRTARMRQTNRMLPYEKLKTTYNCTHNSLGFR